MVVTKPEDETKTDTFIADKLTEGVTKQKWKIKRKIVTLCFPWIYHVSLRLTGNMTPTLFINIDSQRNEEKSKDMVSHNTLARVNLVIKVWSYGSQLIAPKILKQTINVLIHEHAAVLLLKHMIPIFIFITKS